MPSKVSFGDELDVQSSTSAQRSTIIEELSDTRSPHKASDANAPFSPLGGGSSSAHGSSSVGSSKATLKNQLNLHMAKGPLCLKHVPFEYQVIIALLIPVCFIIGILVSSVVEHQTQLKFIQDHIVLAERSQEFEGEFMKERGLIGPYLGRFPNNTAATTAALTKLQGQQLKLDAQWDRYSNEMAQHVDDDQVNDARMTLHTAVVEGLFVNRERVKARNISGTDARAYITRTIVLSQGLIRALMKDDRVANSLPSLVGLMMARHYINYLGVVRGCGNEIVSLDGPMTAELFNEFRRAVETLYETEVVLLDIVTGEARGALHEWRKENAATAHLFGMIEQIYNQTFTFGSSEWFAAMSKSISELETIVLEKVKNELGREEQKESDTAIILMVVATFVSVLAATFIVYWQVKIAGSIAEQQLTLMEVSRVVSSFVPKAFLKTMGTRSIMQISTGQHVNVATTMVFSDIRNFTNLSERMSNEKLFFWLQRYFALMTRVNDTHKGTIDKFIGDAIFSFFPRPADAVRCGIDMQSVVVFLNSTLASENLVQLGVGIHHGVVAFGVFGDENRRTCTMVSSEVNLASRLEGLTKKYGVRILVSEQAMVQVDTENFKHQVMNPLDLAMGHVHDHDHPEAHQRAAAYHSAHHDDVANEEDVFDADNEDEEESASLGHRMLGEVSVKGSGRLVRIFEVFQADEVQVRKYKTKSKEIFTEAVRLQLKKAAGNRDSFKSHTSEYNPLRRRSDEDAAAAQEEAEIAAARSMSCSVVTHLEGSQHPNAPDSAPLVIEDDRTTSPGTDLPSADRPERSPTALPHDLDTSSETRAVRVHSFDIDATNGLPTATNGKPPSNDRTPMEKQELPSVTSISSKGNNSNNQHAWFTRTPLTSPHNSGHKRGPFGSDPSLASSMTSTPRLSPSTSLVPSDALTVQILRLYDQCQAMATEYGVEDPVVAVKRAQAMKGGIDVFNAK